MIHTASALGRHLLRRKTLHRRRWLHRSAGTGPESAASQQLRFEATKTLSQRTGLSRTKDFFLQVIKTVYHLVFIVSGTEGFLFKPGDAQFILG